MFTKELIKKVKKISYEAGFDDFGITDLENFEFYSLKLEEFIKKKYHGEMTWMKEKKLFRKNPKNLWFEARSAIVLGINYGTKKNPIADLKEKKKAYISIYSRRKDYHKVIKSKLKSVARSLQKITKSKVKVFVDTAPLMEKPLGQNAGIGWCGKHTNLVSKKFGSWLFLGVILTDIMYVNKNSVINHCGTCEKCKKICPTNAITRSFVLDARKCISYLTIEHKSHIEKKFRKQIGNRIFGCDDCLAVCPWNKFAKKHEDIKLKFIEKLNMPNLNKLLKFTEEDYKIYFAGTPIRRIGYVRFMRNVLIAVSNSNDISMVEEVKNHLESEHELIKAMAIWALFCLDKKKFKVEKIKRYALERRIVFKKEWSVGDKLYDNM